MRRREPPGDALQLRARLRQRRPRLAAADDVDEASGGGAPGAAAIELVARPEIVLASR